MIKISSSFILIDFFTIQGFKASKFFFVYRESSNYKFFMEGLNNLL